MKKRFLLFFLPCFCQTEIAVAGFTNDTNDISADYRTNGEYMKNGQALTAIGADKAYTGTGGGAYTGLSGMGVTVLLFNETVYASHEDLSNQIKNTSFNTTADDVWGSQMAGIIAAEKNGLGLHGIAYNASVLPLDKNVSNANMISLLSDASYASVKIITGGNISANIGEVASLAPEWGKTKLFVDSSNNTPKFWASSVLKNNVINAVSYNPAKTPDDDHFIAESNNLALGVQNQTLAVPGTFYSAYPPASSPTGYGTDSVIQLSAAAVAGAAALVQEAFPYMTGKQIADVLFSTALKKEDLEDPASSKYVSPYMIQDGKRFLFFTDNTQRMTYTDALAEAIGAGKWVACDPGSGTCSEEQVTFADVFGQGLLNVGDDIVKGPKYFDAARLSEEDYDAASEQFSYTVDTAGYDSEWSRDISQKVVTDPASPYANKNIGLKKLGDGTLTLSGNNTFSGESSVEQGTLILKGSLAVPVAVRGGTFSIEGGTLNGNIVVNSGEAIVKSGTMTGNVTSASQGLFTMAGGTLTGNVVAEEGEVVVKNGTINGNATVASSGQFTLSGGTLNGSVDNQGTAVVRKGTVTGDISNTGIFKAAHYVSENSALQGDFSVAGTLTNNNLFSFEEKGGFTGTLSNGAQIQVNGNAQYQGQLDNEAEGNIVVAQDKTLTILSGAIVNKGKITGSGTIDGTVTNTAEGSVGTSLTIGTLNSAGTIVLDENEAGTVAMNVDRLNITGGGFSLSTENKSLQRGETYTLINFNTLIAFDNFEQQKKLSDFIVITSVQEDHKIQAVVEFLPMSENSLADDLSKEERKILEAIDGICIKQKKADFNQFYFYEPEELKKQVKNLRTKILPVQNDQLPLTRVMASQVHAHLFANSMKENAADVWRPNVRSYYRGRSGGNTLSNNRVWGQFLGGIAKEDGNSSLNQKNMTTRSVGAMFGYDYEFSEKFLLGVLAGTSAATVREGDNETGLRDYRVGLYTSSRFGQVTLNTVMTGGFQKYDSERHLELFGKKENGKAKYNGYSAEFDANLGVDFMRLPYRDYSFFLRSYVAANVNYIYQDAYKEKGAAVLALGVNKRHNTSVGVSPGLTLGYNFYTFSETVMTLDLSYQRIVKGTETHASAYFLADTEKTAFPMASVNTDKEFFNAGLGMKMRLFRNWRLHLWTGTRISRRTEALNFAATFSYNF